MTQLQPINAITIEVRNVYGQMKAYPVCERARSFAKIAGTSTLTRSVLREIQSMGFEVISLANADWRQAA